VVLPAALDPALCRASLAQTWETIEAHVPRMRRGDPSTWAAITPEETAAASAAGDQQGERDRGFRGLTAHLNPLSLFLRTSIPFILRIMSAFLPA
jgi:hypothetical protein